jgi:hypothetical protein
VRYGHFHFFWCVEITQASYSYVHTHTHTLSHVITQIHTYTHSLSYTHIIGVLDKKRPLWGSGVTRQSLMFCAQGLPYAPGSVIVSTKSGVVLLLQGQNVVKQIKVGGVCV